MAESWFYRESAEASERGPVAKSDIDYLKSQGTLRAGMQIRSEFGDWADVTGSQGRTVKRGVHSPAARPRITPTGKQSAAVAGKKPAPVRALSGFQSTNLQGGASTKRVFAAAALLFGLLLLLLLLLKIDGSGIDLGKDVVSGNEGQQSSLEELAATDVGESQTEAEVATSSPESTADSSAQQAADSGEAIDSTTSPVEDTPVAFGSQPTPLDRNIKQSHILSTGAEFFGVRSAGRRFVFLIDASSSMQDGKDAAARRELVESVKRMTKGMELEVMFFTDRVTRVFGKFQSIQDRNRIISEIENANPFMGGTPVMPALRQALRMQPDAIFLLTDGNFYEGDISGEATALNNDDIPINTIAFVNRTMESVLKKVAAESGGDYRYVAR